MVEVTFHDMGLGATCSYVLPTRETLLDEPVRLSARLSVGPPARYGHVSHAYDDHYRNEGERRKCETGQPVFAEQEREDGHQHDDVAQNMDGEG